MPVLSGLAGATVEAGVAIAGVKGEGAVLSLIGYIKGKGAQGE